MVNLCRDVNLSVQAEAIKLLCNMLTDEVSCLTIMELDVMPAIVVCLNSKNSQSVKFALGATLNLTLMN